MAAATASGPGRSASRRFASPLSRALARSHGIELAALAGSGPGGRVVKADVLAALASGGAGVVAPGAAAGRSAWRELPHSFARRTQARRLTESKQQAPHFYLRAECVVDEVQALRAAQAARAQQEGVRLGLNDFVIHAAARALREVPALNASWTDSAMRLYERVHIALAVALDDGLVTPVLEDADRKGVAQIAREARVLAEQARAGQLPAGASSGGTFSISNLGGLGVQEFCAVINPPQAAILAVGAAEPRPVVRDGQLVVATCMTVVLSVDHRAVDGATAARWLASLRKYLEHPSADAVWQATGAAP